MDAVVQVLSPTAKPRALGYARQDQLVLDHGADGYLEMIAGMMAEGESPRQIAASFGMPYIVMRKWLEADKARMAVIDMALRCHADNLAYEALDEVRVATIDDVALRKLRADVFDRRAKQYDKNRYGEKQQIEHSGGVTIVATAQDAEL